MTIELVGVIGAGVMGCGVAQNLAQAGLKVILVDISEAQLQHAQQTIVRSLRLARMLQKTAFSGTVNDCMERISLTTEYEALQQVEFLIENITEKWEMKKSIYPEIDRICPASCVFAVNTSAISITRLASLTNRADRVIGTHFMNPVPLKQTVEVIRGYHTSEETLQITQELLQSLGKKWVVVQDMPGFVSNRVLMLTINEAIFLLQDQVASPEDIDRIFKECFGHPMGPLETADLIGLDTILYSIEVLYEAYNDSKYRPCPLLKKMVDAGLYGRKNGRGFYTYTAN
ncbi:3-hydroxybutyryl-CoA dehydrogenase [Thermosporothrix hazakensis]|uniref:3-hydroxybutyryl-CoA dehydrogenase n=2 Tax=Thermosporothrix TaxID=768650 RepID=A0A326U2U6_THEHA|nr:3-hydroxyacyl-CoA dehydrogenase NAD-binding domain-containing protein [Thermosporothrix hazakensis]PZW26088.1 3-hydroxybutyryl-CoA dehydrogenase [Thermosporothrix hazakensis]BBH87061.1 3-hydroxybutyryl-CoA dehydrogenase [Thermosporothrix sp. COM3]GCE51347.1 3-hydroxybutyryl-CoA dehydrogenase [Thermosporothrix hazakensis]